MNINRGDIWYIGNGYPAVGSEQRPGRPAVVVSNQQNNRYGEVVEVIYLTTAPKRVCRPTSPFAARAASAPRSVSRSPQYQWSGLGTTAATCRTAS